TSSDQRRPGARLSSNRLHVVTWALPSKIFFAYTVLHRESPVPPGLCRPRRSTYGPRTHIRAGLMYATKNDLPEAVRTKLIDLLNARLADAIDLQTQMKQAHWNVKGPSFIALHELFDKINEEVEDYVDDLAERAVQLGGIALGTARSVAQRSQQKEYPLNISSGRDHVEAVSNALATFGKGARAATDASDELRDNDTADIFTEVSRGVDKWLWFVEAHLQAER